MYGYVEDGNSTLDVYGLSGLVDRLLHGGKAFKQYKDEYWAKKTKPQLEPIIDRTTGKIWIQRANYIIVLSPKEQNGLQIG